MKRGDGQRVCEVGSLFPSAVRGLRPGRALFAALFSAGLVACGPPPPPPDGPADVAPEPTRKALLPSVESEVGALDAGQVQAVFSGASAALQDCYARGVGRIAFLAGEIRLAVRVGEDGSTRYAFVKDSTLGDRATESCMLGVLRTKRWPKPVGGKEGNAETSFQFDPGDEERPPVDWDESRMGDGYGKVRPRLSECRKSAGAGPMKATLYVETDGKPLGVGVSGADVKSEEAAGCVVDALMGAKLSSPGSYAAKVTVSID